MIIDIPDSEWLADRLSELSVLLEDGEIDKAQELLENIRSYCGY